MKEKPILFSAPMVRAILEGRKTQTRRCIKPQPVLTTAQSGFKFLSIPGKGSMLGEEALRFSPYGKPGDQLWVRETWAAGKCADAFSPLMLDVKTWKVDNGGLWYSADDCKPTTPISPKGKNRSSIHMPRWASRIDLIIKNIRVERLQDISEEDSVSEGINEAPCLCGNSKCDAIFGSAVEAFQSLWDSINGKPHKTLGDISWEANPYCWVVDFERIKP